MATKLQASHQALLLKAVLLRALRSLAPIYSKLTASAQEIESGTEDSSHSMLVPVWKLVKSIDSFVKEIESATNKEFPSEKATLPKNLTPGEHTKRIIKLTKDVSDWCQKISDKTKKIDPAMSKRAISLRDEAMSVSLNLDSFIPENVEDKREKALLEEYRRLAGIPRRLNS
jgi:hypothetical protein